MRKLSWYVVLVAVLLLVVGIELPHTVQAQSPFVTNGSCAGSASGNFCAYSATQLGVNAIVEPAGGTTALSNTVDTRGAREATLFYTCTQGTYTVNITKFIDDGVTAYNSAQQVITGVGANSQANATFGSEVNQQPDAGSNGAILRFPQRAIAFSFTSASGSPGTCTARLFLAY